MWHHSLDNYSFLDLHILICVIIICWGHCKVNKPHSLQDLENNILDHLPVFQEKGSIMSQKILSTGVRLAWKLELSISSPLLWNLLNWTGGRNTDYKLSVEADFIHNKAPIAAAILKEGIKDLLCSTVISHP